MAPGKYSRVDGRKSSTSYCSTLTATIFIAICLLGVWLLASSPLTPVQNLDAENKDNVKIPATSRSEDTVEDTNTFGDNNANEVSETENTRAPDDASKSINLDGEEAKKFDENSGDLPENITNKDDNVSPKQEEKNEGPQEMSLEKESGHEDVQKINEDKEDSAKDEPKTADINASDGEFQVETKTTEPGKGKDKNMDGEEEGKMEKKIESSEDSKSDQDLVPKSDNSTEVIPSDAELDQGLVQKSDNLTEVFPSGVGSELADEAKAQNGSFSTQSAESKNENEAQKSAELEKQSSYTWRLCNTTAGTDYIPCLDNVQAIRKLRSTKHYEHRERHCPENPPTCLVPLPEGYQQSIPWPTSREKIWYRNVPHTQLVEFKGHQNWLKVSGEHLTFPGGGTQFIHGALHYIDVIQQSVSEISWGKRSRVVLDVGCGVASFGGFLFDRDVLTMSLAPKDEHEAQVQFALERGIPAISAVMGTLRLPFPGRVFDVVHCARCRVPWHIEGGKLLLELNRLLRPGGFFVWSATPIYQKVPEDVEIWQAMKKLAKAMCWEVVSIIRDKLNGVGIAIYRKPTSNECYEKRSMNDPPLCQDSDDASAAWNVPLQACMHKVPTDETERGSKWPEMWPARVEKTPYWLPGSKVGVYGKPAPEDFVTDYEHWKRVVNNSYKNGLGIDWSTVRNVMDMRAVYGGLAAALKDFNVWVMNVVSVDAPDTLPIIYERGLFGIYHNWCESFSTYPRSYDLLHSDHLFSLIKQRCNITALVAEVDRILRPKGTIIVRDTAETISELENMFKSMQWTIRTMLSKNNEGLLCAQKSMWRPKEVETVAYAIE